MSNPETHSARDANARFNKQVDALLLADEADSVLELIERPRGLERFLKLASPHLLRPYAELELDDQKNPCYAKRENEFYEACAQIGLEIPFRTKRILTEQEQREEEVWKSTKPINASKPQSKPPGFSARRNTPRIDQYSAQRLSDYVIAREEQPAVAAPMQVHIIHESTMKKAMASLVKMAATRPQKTTTNHLYLCVAPDVPDEELWKGHSMAAAMVYTPSSGNHAEMTWIADPLPVHASVDGQRCTTTVSNSENLSVDRVGEQIQSYFGKDTKLHIANLPLQEQGVGDLNCRLYSEQLGKAFIRIGRENPNILLQPDETKVENALKRRLPLYYHEKDGKFQLRTRSEISHANQQLRWAMGSEVLDALMNPKAMGKSL